MKPTTPEQFANCYGTFIADLIIVAKVLPAVNTWLQTSLPDVSSAYKLNSSIFTATASITSFPKAPGKPGKNMGDVKAYNKQASVYDKSVTLAWTAITIDLKNALTCAEVDPTLSAKILESFAKLKPQVLYYK